jgi:SpoVK/Ycf46/Vps4 family AAA+-type ATPase
VGNGTRSFVRLKDLHYNEGLVAYLSSLIENHQKSKISAEFPTLVDRSLVILLDGNPGNGKSTLLKSLCGEFGLNYRAFSSPRMTDDNFISLMSGTYSGSAFIFEDCDDMFPSSRDLESDSVDAKSSLDNRISLTTLLNVLQGSLSSPKIIFLTTNKKAALDEAILREGRVTAQVTVLNPTVGTTAKIIRSFLKCSEEESNQLAHEINPNGELTYAGVEGWCERNIRGDDSTSIVSF